MADVFPNVFEAAARVAGRDPIMDRTANRVLDAVKAQARRHRLTGDYIGALSIEETPTGKDRLIVAADPASIPIEFGWLPKTRVEGSRRVQSSGKRVPGLQIMQKAYWSIPRV